MKNLSLQTFGFSMNIEGIREILGLVEISDLEETPEIDDENPEIAEAICDMIVGK